MDVDMAIDGAPPTPNVPPRTSSPSVGSPGSINKLAEPRRRNRPALSCIQCRTRKIRCDRNEPCASCMKSKIVNCTYEEARRPKPRLWRLSPAPTSHPDQSPTSADERLPLGSAFAYRDTAPPPPPTSNLAGPVPSAPQSGRTPEPITAASPLSLSQALLQAQHTDSGSVTGPLGSTAALAERVRQLEQQLADALKRSDYGSPSSRSTHGALSPDHGPPSRPPGASSLVDGDKLFPLAVNVARRIQSDTNSDVYCFLEKCRDLSRTAQARRVPTQGSLQLGKSVPSKDVALRLVESYFRTFESVYRIVHRPSFWQSFQRYWENPDAVDPAFLVQFQLCMALGTCFQDDVCALRRCAAQWIYEAQAWIVSPAERSWVNLGGLQIMCLLHLARETCGVGGDLAWISAGSLMRTAMYLGLHRDPDNLPHMSVFGAEMRRRVWATVLEIVLQSSLDSGAPPLLTLSDFDTRPHPTTTTTSSLKTPAFRRYPAPNAFTQTTVQIALLRSFPIRLAIAQYVNHFSSPASFDETLKWNTELSTACRALSATFQPFYDPAGILPKRLSLFQLRLAEHLVHRFFLALNHPWLWSAHNNPAYYFARKMCVETSLKLYRAIATGSPAGDSGTASQSDDFTRLATCGHGPFRAVPTLAVLTICLELLWQVQEDRSFRQAMSIDHQLDRPLTTSANTTNDPDGAAGAVGMGIGSGAAPRMELLEAVKYAIGWTERRIACGETNVKGYLLFAALLCQAQALQRGGTDGEVERAVLGCVREEVERGWFMLKEAVGKGNADQGFNSIFNIYDSDFFIGT